MLTPEMIKLGRRVCDAYARIQLMAEMYGAQSPKHHDAVDKHARLRSEYLNKLAEEDTK